MKPSSKASNDIFLLHRRRQRPKEWPNAQPRVTRTLTRPRAGPEVFGLRGSVFELSSDYRRLILKPAQPRQMRSLFSRAIAKFSVLRRPALPGPSDGPVSSDAAFRTFTDQTYGDRWDRYVDVDFALLSREADRPLAWVGDEWGRPEKAAAIFRTLFEGTVDPAAERLVEIGPGAGKYTGLVLDGFPASRLLAFDVSRRMLDLMTERCGEAVAAGRLAGLVIPTDHRFLYDILDREGWLGRTDCLFSLDAMVHVDLQYLIAYWLTAAHALKPGGHMIMSVADATSDSGFAKLVSDLPGVFPAMGRTSLKFEWLSPSLVKSLLSRLGFSVRFLNLNDRDCYFVATLERRPDILW